MIRDAFHIDPQDLADVVPECYAAFRPVVAEGLTFFLEHLPPQRLAEAFQAQAKLPADAILVRRLVVFLHACPALHKIGQVLARNRRLDPELRRHLQELESLEPHTPFDQLLPLLQRELAPATKKYRIELAEQSLAEGSVAVVVPLTWSDPADGPREPRRQAVAKLLKPGVEQRLDEDLAILGKLADFLADRWAVYGLPPLPYQAILADVAELLTTEVQLGQEQVHLRLAESQLAGQPDVQVPRLLPFSTGAVTAMERLHGRKVTDSAAVRPWRRRTLFHTMVRALLGRVLFSRDPTVLFHGDPHAGNLLATPDGRLGILDWSLARQLTSRDRVALGQLLVGALKRNAVQVAAAAAGLASPGADDYLVRRHVDAALAELPWHRLPGLLWATGLLDCLAHAGLRFPPRLLLFRKTLLTLEGVLADLYPAGSLDAALTTEGLVQFAWEWPLRWLKPLDDHDYGTHLSSADLIDMCMTALRTSW
jgi:ubiquinone biosynthesis protein